MLSLESALNIKILPLDCQNIKLLSRGEAENEMVNNPHKYRSVN
jgi:hypothetical protein